jgi:probable phosphoglycerate mutase
MSPTSLEVVGDVAARSVDNVDVVTSTQPRELPVTAVRHGETDWNIQRLIQGHTNTSLNAAGLEQARELADALRGLGFDFLVTSDLDRAMETAAIVGDALGLVPLPEPLLRERCFGVLEGQSANVLTSAVTGIVDGVYVDPDARPEGGESFREVVSRAQTFLERAASEWADKNLLVVTHGGMVHALRAATSPPPLENMKWFPVTNCSVWEI